jgi:hypothetical protein
MTAIFVEKFFDQKIEKRARDFQFFGQNFMDDEGRGRGGGGEGEGWVLLGSWAPGLMSSWALGRRTR